MQSKLNVGSDGRNVCAAIGLNAHLKRKQKSPLMQHKTYWGSQKGKTI